LDKVLKSQSLGIDLGCTVDGRSVCSMDGSLPTKTGPAAAMMRQIAQETIDAYETERT
jgi:hypothetical protein